jgi:ectoine hydroxylase-related dioxygenase (phytanoyl-CoA dioxygenase family)
MDIMRKQMSKPISIADINSFRDDGVVVLRGIFRDWITSLTQGANFHINHPSEGALVHKADGHKGNFLEDFCCWERIPEYRDFVLDSPLGRTAAELMRSKTSQFFHDHYLHKEANSGVATPWHQDIPYYCVQGSQTVSFWLPLESRDFELSLRCAAGSHKLDKEIRPTSWSNNESFYADDELFMDIPDIECSDFEIKQWAIEPGDVVAFDFRTIHGAKANIKDEISRTLSFRLVGDDVTYRQRSGRTSPNFPDISQQTGERLREDWFPTIWTGERI